ncbi:hypothetical protein ACGFSI_16565 [Streptomyces virginiae]|uniref:hypothetical protein n=1 Tax=Streptomyces virginiae TaxID=1961 RepID=UPI00371CA378
MSVEGDEPSVPLTAQDVTGTWQGDHGARLEVTADGRARLGSDVRAYFHGQRGAGRETYRRTATP